MIVSLIVSVVRRTRTGSASVVPMAYSAIVSIKVECAHERAIKRQPYLTGRGERALGGEAHSLLDRCRARVGSASGREETTAAIMLAARQGVPLSEQVVSAPETAMQMTDRDVVRVERKHMATGGRVARESALEA